MSDRLVQIIAASPPIDERDTRRLFSEFQERANIVLLGDPGSGKSHLFRFFADREAGRFLTVRSFLNVPNVTGDPPLFVDALDERRSGRGDHATIDALVQKLFSVNPAKVRISCRAQDWLGETDLATLRDYFDGKGGYVVVALDELSSDERDAIIVSEGFNEPAAFAADAARRQLHYLLTNPQNLIMLCRVVKAKGWPETRTDMFQRMTELLLTEHNDNKTHGGDGVYCADELRDAAGAICAARLISDVAAVSRAEASAVPDVPSYRTLACEDLERIRATLGRRVFSSVSGSDAVDYVHRTTAEYLAASWLAKRIRSGLPLGRVRALIGIDGHPTPELRGLHAWLAVLLPEHAEGLIAADPYGVLTYADTASLSLSSRRHLLSELGRLSQTDPLFRSGSWSLPALGALARPDMVAEFSRILQSKTENFAYRSCVLEALAVGAPLPELQSELMTILIDGAAPYAERSDAMDALMRLGPQAEADVARAYASDIGQDSDGLRLRAEIMAALYASHFGPADVSTLLTEVLRSEHEAHLGPLRGLASSIPLLDAMALLDASPRVEKQGRSRSQRRNANEILYLLDALLIRVVEEPAAQVDGHRLWVWLRARRRLTEGTTYWNSDDLKTALVRHQDVLIKTVPAAAQELVIDNNSWNFVHRLREATLHLIDEQDLLDQLFDCMRASGADKPKQAFLYELSLHLSFRPTERALAVLNQLHDMATDRPDLEEILTKCLSNPLEDWHKKQAQRRADSLAETQERREQDVREFARDREAIRRGVDYAWMTWIAELYLRRSGNADKSLSPRARIAAELGEENAQIAIEGLIAVAFRDDLPSLEDILLTLGDEKYYPWWIAIIAGLDEASSQQLDLSRIATSTLQAALVIGTTRSLFSDERDEGRTWKRTFLAQQPELARDAFMALARSCLIRQKPYVEGLHTLLHDAHLAPFRTDLSLRLLRDFPDAVASVLVDLLQAALAEPQARDELLSLTANALRDDNRLSQEQRRLWLATGYILDPAAYEAHVAVAAPSDMIWPLRDLSGTDYRRRGKAGYPLTVGQLAFMAAFVAGHFPNTQHPKGGWSGSRNPWDGAEYARGLVTQIAASSTAQATDALLAFERSPAFGSYAEHIKHALATQRTRRREAEYQQPDWPQTIQALQNAAPANASDLHALLVAHLEDARARIAGRNTDIYKHFWNEDSHGRLVKPKIEESGRDALIEVLAPRLLPVGVILEPEGHMVADKRADVVASHLSTKIVAELKRDTHADLWTAAENQLDRLYARDPDTAGFGIYVVFWYGEERASKVPAGPSGQVPGSAADLERILREGLHDDKKSRIAVIVLDVSGSSDARSHD